MTRPKTRLRPVLVVAALLALTACAKVRTLRHSTLDCMERAMYFESIRSSRDGLVAVGSVVMNRVASNDYPNSVCGVVAQRGQFAPGIMSSRMDFGSAPLVAEAARAVLRGERHPFIANAQFFHAASYHADYNNIHYVLVTGGNAFYERRRPEQVTQPSPPAPLEGVTGR